jgi:hypothetical protein
MTQPRDGNRDLPLTGIFPPAFSLRQTVHRESLCRVIAIGFAISFTGSPPFDIPLGTEVIFFADPLFPRPSGFHTAPPSSRFSPPLLAFPSLVFPYEKGISIFSKDDHTLSVIWDRRSGTYHYLSLML